jgi:hypothetical protein
MNHYAVSLMHESNDVASSSAGQALFRPLEAVDDAGTAVSYRCTDDTDELCLCLQE